MALDYSKWDALELSDDSDFEPHPNVDKRSFIRAKQNQIHMQREHRKNQIETLKYERIINDGLLRRIDTLIAELRRQESDVQDRAKVLFQALMASAGDPDEDEPPTPPAGVHSKDEPIRYSQMMASLIDQVQKEVDESKTDNWLQGYTKALEEHKEKVTGLQKNLLTKLAELEKEESRKITSDKIHDGFNVSSVSKEKDTKAGGKSATKAKTVELLNPASLEAAQPASSDGAQSSGADADVDEVGGALGEEDEDHIQASKHGKEFAKIKMGDYQRDLRFISEHHEILTERETDALLIMAFDAQLKGRVELAKQYIHQGLLLQYCRSLGPDGVRLFFKRITTPGHPAQRVFQDDVINTFNKIKTRTAEIAKERAANPSEGQVEQIQLQAVEPGTEIHINIPRPKCEDEIEQHARVIFEGFPPGLQRAMETGSLDKVNEVLGKMSVEEAEEVVNQMGESGMLDMREGVIDGTTAEGQEQLRQMKDAQLHEQAKADPEAGELAETAVAGPG